MGLCSISSGVVALGSSGQDRGAFLSSFAGLLEKQRRGPWRRCRWGIYFVFVCLYYFVVVFQLQVV